MAGERYGNDYFVKTGNGARNNSGPSGRKLRPYRLLRAALTDSAASQTAVLWCSDQHKNRGTGIRAKWDSDKARTPSAAEAARRQVLQDAAEGMQKAVA